MKVNDSCVVEIYNDSVQTYCCTNLATAVSCGVYHICFVYSSSLYALILGKSDPRINANYIYYCPFCGKVIDEHE